VAAIDPLGYVRLVDRTKDLVKSGGEWISSVALENEIMGHPKVAEAAVIAVSHPKWSERPLACVVLKDGESAEPQEIRDYLAERLGKWQVPDDVVFIEEIPKTSVGKFSKKTLRDRFADYVLPDA
jgi:fatty-acyl-CoA synthase